VTVMVPIGLSMCGLTDTTFTGFAAAVR
jgi:hypothetical protein